MTENIEHTILEVSVSDYDLAKSVVDYIIEDIESNLHKLEAYNDTESFRLDYSSYPMHYQFEETDRIFDWAEDSIICNIVKESLLTKDLKNGFKITAVEVINEPNEHITMKVHFKRLNFNNLKEQ